MKKRYISLEERDYLKLVQDFNSNKISLKEFHYKLDKYNEWELLSEQTLKEMSFISKIKDELESFETEAQFNKYLKEFGFSNILKICAKSYANYKTFHDNKTFIDCVDDIITTKVGKEEFEAIKNKDLFWKLISFIKEKLGE